MTPAGRTLAPVNQTGRIVCIPYKEA